MTYPAAGSIRRTCTGFTVVEIAMVVAIVGLLIGAITVPLATQIESRKIENSEQLLQLAEEKLLAYTARFGFFPCPADGASNGLEAAGFNHTTGACSTWHGFLPASTIGFTPVDEQGYAVDAWGSRIRYAISNQTVGGVANPFTAINAMQNAGIASIMSTPLFSVCGSGSGVNPGVDCGTAQTLASNVPIVIWSVGPNATTGGTSMDEAQNPNPNGGSSDRIFVRRERSATAGAEYDDVVRWLPAPLLISRLRTAGML